MRVYSSAPCRISLFGGGTDVPPYSDKFGGVCISVAINIRQEVILNEVGDWKLEPFDNPDFFHLLLDSLVPGNRYGIEHTFRGEIESGLGTSASLAVALVGAVNKIQDWKWSLSEIAEKARELEVDNIGLFTGRQDQYAAAYGGFNIMSFFKDIQVWGLRKELLEPVEPYLMLFHNGVKRQAANILDGYKFLDREKIEMFNQIKILAYQGIGLLSKKDVTYLARTLNESWEMKKKSSVSVTNPKINMYYDFAIESGALAGKVCGAGGGGYMVFIVPPDIQEEFTKKVEKKGLRRIDFSADWKGLECRFL